MKRWNVSLVAAVVANIGQGSVIAGEPEGPPRPQSKAVRASAKVLSGVAVNWSSPYPERLVLRDPRDQQGVSCSTVKYTRADGKVVEIEYVDFV